MPVDKFNQNNNSFYCKSCNKELIDFREKTSHEIADKISCKEICGIFYSDQLFQPVFPFKFKLYFAVLTLFAFLGFNVKPVSAQTLKADSIVSKAVREKAGEAIQKNQEDKLKAKKKEKTKYGNRKKNKFRVIGTPSF